MANGTPLSAAGQQLFGGTGLGDMLAGQVSDETEELRRRRLAQMGRPDLGMGGYGGSRAALASPAGSLLAGFGGRLR
jgi:hypothetical protein